MFYSFLFLVALNVNVYGNGGKAACEAEAKRGGTSCFAAVFQHNVSILYFHHLSNCPELIYA